MSVCERVSERIRERDREGGGKEEGREKDRIEASPLNRLYRALLDQHIL